MTRLRLALQVHLDDSLNKDSTETVSLASGRILTTDRLMTVPQLRLLTDLFITLSNSHWTKYTQRLFPKKICTQE